MEFYRKRKHKIKNTEKKIKIGGEYTLFVMGQLAVYAKNQRSIWVKNLWMVDLGYCDVGIMVS